MKQMLRQLRTIPGIKGALVMTPDGVVVDEMEGTPRSEETAAYVSTIFLSIESESSGVGLFPLKRLTVWAADGRLIILPFEDFALVVMADSKTDLGYALLEVTSVARALLRHSQIQV